MDYLPETLRRVSGMRKCKTPLRQRSEAAYAADVMVSRTSLAHLSPDEKRQHKKEYLRLYQKRHRFRLTDDNRRWREKYRKMLRIRWSFRRKFNRIMKYGSVNALERKQMLKKKYGLTLEQFAEMTARQDGRCAICRQLEKRMNKHLCVDHCHKTGRIRELLCHDCNTALGAIHENANTLRSMIAYIEKHHG